MVILVGAAAALLSLRARDADAVAVILANAERREVFRSFVTASGEIVATNYADVGSSVMGTVVELLVKEGDRVRAAQTLARIDAVQARGDNAAAEAEIQVLESEQAATVDQVTVARSDLEAAMARADELAKARARALMLHEGGLLPAADRDAAVAAADSAAAQARAARAALARAEQAIVAAGRRIAQARAQATRVRDVLTKTNITSPIDGVVSRLRVRQGEMVVIGIQNQPGTTLMTISDLSAIDAEVKVPEADVTRLALDQEATVVLDAAPGKSFAGRVVEIGTSALPVQGSGAAAREFRVVVRLDNGEGLRPGMTCDAEILAQQRLNVIVVPLQSVVLRSPSPDQPERSGVFVVKEGRAEFVPVSAGIIGGLSIEVSGLADGMPVIAGPYQVLRTLKGGEAVRVSD